MIVDKSMLKAMRHSPVRNYVIPGLTSWLIGEPSPKGTMRFFECSRNHQETITPHSHRFDFQCWVLAGKVTNRVWTGVYGQRGDAYAHTNLVYGGEIGCYERIRIGVARYEFTDTEYRVGEWYSMKAHEIHSIQFAAGTEVLFFEGPTVTDQSAILEPWVDGEDIPTFKVEPWMFKKPAAAEIGKLTPTDGSGT